MTDIDRRSFVKKGVLGVAGVAAAAAGACTGPRDDGAPAVHTRPNLRWRLVSSFPRSLDAIFGNSEVLAQRIDEISEGRFTIRPYPAGEIVPGLQVLDAVQQGTVQMGQTASYYYTGKRPALAFETCFPFGLTARQQTAWLEEAGGRELMNELFAELDIVTFPGGNTGAQMGGWFKHEIHTAADLQGLKMRIPGLGGSVMDRLGVTVQVLAGGDIYPALERGVIDATEWVGPYDDEKLGFYKVAQNYYYPGWWEPGPSLAFYVNRQAWESLPSSYQAMLRAATAEAAQWEIARYDARNPAALERLLDRGVMLRRFSTEIMEAAHAASFELMEEHAAADPGFATIYAHWTAFRKQSFRWFGTAEWAYGDFAFGRA